MQIDPIERSVQLNVGELASFRNKLVTDRSSSGHWRASIGRDWHQTMEQQTRNAHPDARFEIPLSAQWRHSEWLFKIKGRMDQLIPTANGYLIREIKTIRHTLPSTEEDLVKFYPDYFAQIAIYLRLASIQNEYTKSILSASLILIDIDTGTVQTVEIDTPKADMFERQLNAMIPFLQDRRNSLNALKECSIKPAYKKLRGGQAQLQTTLNKSALQAKTVLLEAPTGFGKTGIVLEHALRHLQLGVYNRCIYLSSKSTGQLETIKQLRAMSADAIRYLQMRNRKEHSIDTPTHTCSTDKQCEHTSAQLWRDADIHPGKLFKRGTFELENAKDIGAKNGLCPYALTKSCLPYADIWIGDTNYVFSPQSRGVFIDTIGFDPSQTLLIVDEAHNLPQRAAEALGIELSATELLFAYEELRVSGAPRRFLRPLEELSTRINTLRADQTLSSNTHYTLLDLCEDIEQQIAQIHIHWNSVPPFVTELVWRVPPLAKCLAASPQKWLHWSPSNGVLRATCLDARKWISDCITPFGGSILMSATLSPIEHFREDCGISNANSIMAPGYASWREGAYDVAIDTRIDTRLKNREDSYLTTAQTVAAMINESTDEPIAVFFSSYHYAQNIEAYLSKLHPEYKLSIQPRRVDLEEQKLFMEHGLKTADALFLILGSSYSEGVDQLGGRITKAMVVGPALPEVNCVQEARLDALSHYHREMRFQRVFIEPAMRRIHQALGRLVRAPEHKAKILLHGRRYAENAYYDQLADEYKTDQRITNQIDLINWLRRKTIS